MRDLWKWECSTMLIEVCIQVLPKSLNFGFNQLACKTSSQVCKYIYSSRPVCMKTMQSWWNKPAINKSFKYCSFFMYLYISGFAFLMWIQRFYFQYNWMWTDTAIPQILNICPALNRSFIYHSLHIYNHRIHIFNVNPTVPLAVVIG